MQEGSLVSFPIFRSFAKLLCLVSTRPGGFSLGGYAGLNLGKHTGDLSSSVCKNRDYFFHRLSLTEQQVAFGEQVHSTNVRRVDGAGIYQQTDALITREKNVFLAVVVADCFPVFLFDPGSATVAVIHAGWRGTQAGIIENTLERFKSEPAVTAGRIIAAIGPGLQSECFEVRKDVYELFAQRYLSVHPEADKKYLNLRQVIVDKLLQQGVPEEQIGWNSECTFCSAEKYYSYRRDGKNSGRMMGIIGIQ
jgi:YfiH family protein